MFRCAFIGDEKVESFEWVLGQFKKVMNNKSPISIFTDQDLAMSKAIEKVKIFGTMLYNIWVYIILYLVLYNLIFGDIIMGCNSKEEFNECWDNILTTYEMKENEKFYKWFDRLYKIRHKWCTLLSKDFFSAGILSS